MPAARSHADVAYERVREIALRFPAAAEKLSHGAPSFHVRGKMYLTYVDDHHGDGRLAVWCKSTVEEQKRLVAENPVRYFVPPYVGVKGWIGIDVHPARADWIDLSILVENGWASVAPPRLLRCEVKTDVRPPPARVARVTTDAATARAAFDRFCGICLALPGVTCDREGRHATFRVRKKVFAYFLDNHHGDGAIAACIKGDRREHARAIAKDPAHFYLPAYVGPRGYLGVRLEPKRVDWKGVTTRTRAAYESTAPKR
jgi:hypothetical protein